MKISSMLSNYLRETNHVSKKPPTITVYEHKCLYLNKGEQKLTADDLKSLQLFYGERGVPYYSLIHEGVRFNKYVGVIQVGKTVIEVLPKLDKTKDTVDWKRVLISMLQAVGVFKVHTSGLSDLQLKSNSILDLY